MKFPPSSLLLLLHSATASTARRPPLAAAAAVVAFQGSPLFASSFAFRRSACSTAVVPSLAAAAASAPSAGATINVGGRGSARWGSRSRSAATAAAAALSVAAGGASVVLGASTSTASCEGEADTVERSGLNGSNGAHAAASAQEAAGRTAIVPFPEEALKHDTYNGVTIDVGKVPAQVAGCPEAFATALGTSLEAWEREGRRGIWIRMTTEFSSLIPSITGLGFDFQHAEPGKVTLTKWLPSHEESRLPRGPTHQIGVGTLVLHPRNGKMLAVQEKTGPAAARKLWKMPTGLTDPSEDIADAAIRELKEETGLDCVFDKIICFRQAHSGGHLNHSDMFFVCLLRLHPKYEEGLSRGEEVPLHPQEEEIAEVAWIDMERYANQDAWLGSPLYSEMNDAMIHAARDGIEYRHVSEETADGGEDDDTASAAEGVVHVNGHAVPTSASRGKSGGFVARTLPVGFRPGTNTIYLSKL